MTTAELRKKLKAIGYKLQLKTSSLGTCAKIIHSASGQTHGNVEFSDTQWRWDLFNTFVDEHTEELLQWQKDAGVFGVKSWIKGQTVI